MVANKIISRILGKDVSKNKKKSNVYREEYREKSGWEQEQYRQSEIADENRRYRKEYGNDLDEYGN